MSLCILLIDPKIASNLKSACFGIGIRKDAESGPLLVSGTGFFIDSNGFFVTAGHVVEEMESQIEILKNRFPDAQLAAVRITQEEKKVRINTHSIKARVNVNVVETPTYYGQERFDVCVGRVQGTFGNLPFLNIKDQQPHKLYSDVLMCGYPGGSQTLHTFTKERGLKTSPIMQRGIISSIIPSDNATKPIGIITDIIGTGGSSGSPIIDANDGEVIAIAQQVVGGDVTTRLINNNNIHDFFGTVNIGVTFGVSNYMLYPTVRAAKKRLSEVVDANGNIIGDPMKVTETMKIDMGGNKID